MESYERYGPAVRRKCERMLRSPEDAEDVVQSLFVDLLSRGRTDVDLPYLYRAATNRCLNIMRDTQRRLRLLEREHHAAPEPRAMIDDRVAGLNLLARIVERLDAQTAEVLVYRFLDEMELEEIAGLTGVSRKTVSKRLKKIEAMAERLGEKDGGAR
ncbi:MAG: sigma-70 family RNA polymerase sigma factor [Myxococcota bacterium]|jgi:RNA polymerase sigma-70 factor (ECF subfamily)|nr:sigma-70 family RNA polymerase sigma factor [Myxococcota bacterium]